MDQWVTRSWFKLSRREQEYLSLKDSFNLRLWDVKRGGRCPIFLAMGFFYDILEKVKHRANDANLQFELINTLANCQRSQDVIYEFISIYRQRQGSQVVVGRIRWAFKQGALYFLDTQMSLSIAIAPTPVSLSVVRHTFRIRFPFCQRPWDLTKRRDDIAVAHMFADIVTNLARRRGVPFFLLLA